MRHLIQNDLSKCVGCNRCIRVCPVDEASCVFIDGNQVRVKIDNSKCIACGACLSACQHEARYYEDDTARFFEDLKKGASISVLCAPAARANLQDWDRVLTWLRKLGVKTIFDVSMGADICTWAYIRWIQKNKPKTVISQPCPAIVDYILLHNPSLLPYLSPIHSPMLCTAIYMRRYQGIHDKIAAISPCIAKANEFEETGGIVSYNVTFKNLENYLIDNKISLPREKSDYDHPLSGLGSVYSYPGGLKENVEFFLGKSLRVDKSEGQSVVYKSLDTFGNEHEENWPAVFDVLNCSEGCNLGTGTQHVRSVLEIGMAMDRARKKSLEGRKQEYSNQMLEDFDQNLKLEDFIRSYYSRPVRKKEVTEKEMEDAFAALGKMDPLSRMFNCGACGANTCTDMAKKIVRKVNIAENCIQKAHGEMQKEQKVIVDWRNCTRDALQSLTSKMTSIHGSSELIREDMGKIKEIINIYEAMTREIDKIADNIHIISLNASIEAAKAGDHGKSFAVVAEAIRSLAKNTQTATMKIGQSSTKAKDTMKDIEEKVTNIVSAIGEASENLQDVSGGTEEVNLA
jgi:iron only hydrogenase large subunit-like protein